MCVRYLEFVLLVCVPGVLFAQTEPCPAPSLNAGYLVPEQEAYTHEQKLTYACDNGRKPAVEGWWATSTCLNGEWSHKPHCIDEKACVPPTIPNAIYTANTNGWYEDRDTIRIKCDEGYELKDRDATARCINGTWSSVPVCQKNTQACDAPPKIPHAVIILQGYQEVFVPDVTVQYECEDGYTAEGADAPKKIICIAGNWTEGPTCSRGTRPGVGHGGAAGGGHTTGSGMQPVGGVHNCGKPPKIANGDVVRNDGMTLEYQCAHFYKRVGWERVVCYSDGTWSDVPTCKAAFCFVDTNENFQLISVGSKYIKDGERVKLECEHLSHWWTVHFSVAQCTDGRLTLSKCCNWLYRVTDNC